MTKDAQLKKWLQRWRNVVSKVSQFTRRLEKRPVFFPVYLKTKCARVDFNAERHSPVRARARQDRNQFSLGHPPSLRSSSCRYPRRSSLAVLTVLYEVTILADDVEAGKVPVTKLPSAVSLAFLACVVAWCSPCCFWCHSVELSRVTTIFYVSGFAVCIQIFVLPSGTIFPGIVSNARSRRRFLRLSKRDT